MLLTPGVKMSAVTWNFYSELNNNNNNNNNNNVNRTTWPWIRQRLVTSESLDRCEANLCGFVMISVSLGEVYSRILRSFLLSVTPPSPIHSIHSFIHSWYRRYKNALLVSLNSTLTHPTALNERFFYDRVRYVSSEVGKWMYVLFSLMLRSVKCRQFGTCFRPNACLLVFISNCTASSSVSFIVSMAYWGE
jgi:hypothetical protein